MRLSCRLSFIVATTCISALPAFVHAAGSAPKPTICTRSCWGARAPAGGISYMSSLTRAIVHHTAGSEFNTTGLADSKADVRAIQNLHINNGWSDIGYHFLVDKFGNIFEGRSGSMSSLPRGAHDATNTNSFGFNVMGYFHPSVNNVPTAAMMDGLYDVIAWRMPGGWTPYGSPGVYGELGISVGRVDGHRRVKSTACPGDNVFNVYMGTNMNAGAIRSEIQTRMNGGGAIATYVSPDAVSWSSGRIDVVVRGGGNAIFHKYFVSGTGWLPSGGFQPLGGTSASRPAICSWAPARLDVFVRGTTDKLHHNYYTNSDWQASSNWEDLGGTLSSGPDAVSWGSGRIDVVARGGGNEVYHKWYDSGSGWSPWESLGGEASSSPAICSRGEGKLDVFVRGGGDNLYHKWYDGTQWLPDGRLGSWENLGGTLTSSPDAVANSDGRIDVVVRGGGDKIYHKYYLPGSGWLPDDHFDSIDGDSSSGPGISSWAPGRLDVFVRGQQGDLEHAWFAGGAWSGWESLGGTLQ